ncbi:polyprotein [Abeliophyllum distichum]|uniref:Polyprotein n=1 Tax=Abeliophyllum distichum TaxID=126358 RepID=A0ABD1SDT4_9LAMI
MLREKSTPPQKTFSGLEVIAWNIDGMTEHQIMQVIAEMSMASSAYLAKGNTDQEASINIMNGFSGQLKNWWFNYLSSDEREKITHAVKKEGDNHLDPAKQDAVCTILFTIIKHFIGEPSSFMEKPFELLMNLTCPKLQDFRWYKDIFLQKVMFRDDCKSAFWKERFIAGLLKLFAEKVRNAIKDGHSTLPYNDLTFGQIIGFINKEGFSVCNDLKLKVKLKSDKMEGRKELGSFCEQYGYERIYPPPSRSHNFSQKHMYPMPQKKDLLNRLLNAVIFSKFDLKSGFWQIQIDEKDRYKTAFNVPFGQYEWNVMSFGLKNAPSEFQKIMNDIFNPYQNFSIVYIDDVLVYSDSIEQHLKHLQIFLSVARKNGIAVSEKKIVLCQTRIKFLGHEIFRVQSWIDQQIKVKTGTSSSQSSLLAEKSKIMAQLAQCSDSEVFAVLDQKAASMAKAESSRGSVAASEVGSDPDPNFVDDNEDDCLEIDVDFFEI